MSTTKAIHMLQGELEKAQSNLNFDPETRKELLDITSEDLDDICTPKNIIVHEDDGETCGETGTKMMTLITLDWFRLVLEIVHWSYYYQKVLEKAAIQEIIEEHLPESLEVLSKKELSDAINKAIKFLRFVNLSPYKKSTVAILNDVLGAPE